MSGIDNNTLLYLRGDSFVDISLNPKSITNYNNGATIIDSNVFGKVIHSSNNDGYLIASVDSSFVNGDYTIEYFKKVNQFATKWGDNDILFKQSNSFKYITVTGQGNTLGSNHFMCGWHGNDSFNTKLVDASNMPSVGTWYHVAIVKNDNLIRVYINGKDVTTNPVTKDFNYIDNELRFFSSETTGLLPDYYSFRIYNIARYTSDFIPKNKPFN